MHNRIDVLNNPVNWVDPWGLNAGTLTWGTAIKGTSTTAGTAAAGTGAVVVGVAGGIVLGFPSTLGDGTLPPGILNECDDCEETPISDLDPLHSPETIGDRPDISDLSDEELLDSVRNPQKGDYLKKNTNTGKICDGNTRATELKKRANDPNSSINPNDTVPVKPHTPDNSMFWDL